MKKLSTLLLIASISLTAVYAQEITIGAKAGLNFATLQPDLSDPATRTSLHLGGMAEISINEMFSIQPELLYSAQGAKDKSDDDEVFKLSYLSLPIMVKYYVMEGLSIEAGPQIGFLLSAEVEDDGETYDLKDDTKGLDFGFSIGAGYKLESGLNFGLRYYLGSDVNDISEDSDQFKNRVFQISVGYFFKGLN